MRRVRRIETTAAVDDAELTRLRTPRRDVVEERPDGPDRFVLAHGPFAAYERTLAVAEPDGDGGRVVTQRFAYRLAPATWRFLFGPAMARALRRPRPDGKLPWWYPPERLDAHAATTLGLLAALALAVGYHGTLLAQTMTFIADEFDASRSTQGAVLSAARLSGLLAIGLGVLADRRGRRIVLLLSLLACIGSTALGALAPNLASVAATQIVNRGGWAAATVLLAVVIAEEMPKGARAYSLGLVALSTGLGAGMALWLLPLADLGERAWRLLYLASLAFLPLVALAGRHVPESRRFERPHAAARLAGHRRHLVLLGVSVMLLNVFVAPQTQFRNEFLRDERGMTAAAVSLFVLATSTPGGIGIVTGGRQADVRGRRVVGATAAVVGSLLLAASFTLTGFGMWASAMLGTIFMAALDPIVRVYGPELFPTALRGRAAGILSMTAMVGSAAGLLVAGVLTDALGSFGRTMGVLTLAPLALAALVVLKFPETARRELEDINPEDRLDGVPAAARADPAVMPPGVTEEAGVSTDSGISRAN